jgi:glycosyltransferase involved in cell wall biosynthesis
VVSVGVLVDLQWSPQAGGQVKCWERFAHAATAFQKDLDLTVHFLGDEERTVPVAGNVRYVTHPPLLSTARFRFTQLIREHTDLAPLRPGLFRYLRNYDVIHTTHATFAFAKTAVIFAKRFGRPLVHSIHTDAPKYTRIYFPQILRRLLHDGWLSRLLLDRFQFADRCAASMARKLDRYIGRCDWVLVSQEADLRRTSRAVRGECVSFLRRGVDKNVFHPRWRDRARLNEIYGIPPDRCVLLFVGRVDPVKSVATLAHAARNLLDRGTPVHVMIAGDGSERDAIRALLGPAVTLPGVLPQATVAWLYASADLFVFPSETEVYPNAVIEAKASGLPVLVAPQGGAAQCLKAPGVDGLIVEERRPDRWAHAIEDLRANPARRAAMGAAARRHIEEEWPTWEEVLANDLMPVWRALAQKHRVPRAAVSAP